MFGLANGFLYGTLREKGEFMKKYLQLELPEWQKTAINKIAKKNKMSQVKLALLSINYLMINYDGKLDMKVFSDLEFEARKKIESLK